MLLLPGHWLGGWSQTWDSGFWLLLSVKEESTLTKGAQCIDETLNHSGAKGPVNVLFDGY